MSNGLPEILNLTTFLETNEKDILFDYLILTESLDGIGILYIPKLMTDAVVCYCERGICSLLIDAKNYELKAGDMCVIFPNSILQAIRKSDDFKGDALVVQGNFMNNIDIPSVTSLYMYIKDNPCISLSGKDAYTILSLFEQTKEKSLRRDHPFRNEISEALIMVLCYEIAAIYMKHEPVTIKQSNRYENHFFQFLNLLAVHYKTERKIGFYAGKLCITPKYLSDVIKKVSGHTAAEWISQTVLRNMKVLLKDHELTIQQISEELNFPNPSFFSQYFKKYAGMTPKEFREKG